MATAISTCTPGSRTAATRRAEEPSGTAPTPEITENVTANDGKPAFANLGVHLRVLWPGDPNALYHSEGAQEGFLVLSGECVLIVEDQERRLRQWDYFHCPAGTSHALVGAGKGPCSILMIGARPDEPIRFPVSAVAAKHDASVATETAAPDEAYADWPGSYDPVRMPWPG